MLPELQKNLSKYNTAEKIQTAETGNSDKKHLQG